MAYQPKVVKKIWSWVQIVNLFLLLALPWGSPALAAVGVPEDSDAQSRHILWKVRSPRNTIFLAGSIHVLQKHHYPLPQVFDESFNQSSRIMCEVDLDDLASPQAQMNMLKKGLYLNGETLPTALAPKNYATAKTTMIELELQIENFHRMKPWMVASTAMTLELKKLRFENAYGVDRYFYAKAQAAGKPIQALETVEFQLNLFDQLSAPMQEQFLLQTLEDLKTLDTQVHGMVKSWKAGNVQELETILKGIGEYPELYQALVVKRNNNWLPDIEQALQEKEPVFMVVGALHLLGKEGLVAILKEKGYLVQQL